MKNLLVNFVKISHKLVKLVRQAYSDKHQTNVGEE